MRVDAGWDNVLRRLGEQLAVRMPRRPAAAWLTEKELRWLPEIAPRLPLTVPLALRTGALGCGYPWPWAVVPWLGGEPGDREPVADPESALLLARFLRALHEPAPTDAPRNQFRGAVPRWPTSRKPFNRTFITCRTWLTLTRCAKSGRSPRRRRPRGGAPVWLHADLHPANIMVTAGALAAGWTLLPRAATASFLDAYGDIDDATLARARGWAVRCGISLISEGLAGQPGLRGGKPSWLRGGVATIENVLVL